MFFFFNRSNCSHKLRVRHSGVPPAYLVVEHPKAIQGVQVLLEQRRTRRVQVHLVQLQYRHGHPEEGLVHRGVLHGKWKSHNVTFKAVAASQRHRRPSCSTPPVSTDGRTSCLTAHNGGTAEGKCFWSLSRPPTAVPSLPNSLHCSQNRQTQTALHQTEQKRVLLSTGAHTLKTDCNSAHNCPGNFFSKSKKHAGRIGIQWILGLLSSRFF